MLLSARHSIVFVVIPWKSRILVDEKICLTHLNDIVASTFYDFKALLKGAGLPPIRFHDLRHAAASLMLNNDIPVIVVSRRLGHARASITLDVYGHLIPSLQTEAARLIDELVMPVPVDLENSAINS